MGTGGIVTAGLSTYRPVTGHIGEEEQPTPTQLTSRMMTVLPALAPLEGCRVLGLPPLLSAVGGESFVATVQCTGSSPGVRIQTSGATLTIPVPPGPSALREPDVSSLRAAGPMVAWVETHLPPPPSQLVRTLVIARATTGHVLARTRLNWFPVMLGLGSDGTVVLMETVTDFPCAVRIVTPAAPTPRRVALRTPCGEWDAPIAIAGGRFVYGSANGFGVSDLQGSAYTLAEASGKSPLAFDGRTAYVVRADCDADRLLAVDVNVRGTVLSPTSSRTTACPVRRAGPALLRVANAGVRIAMRCPKGCRGTLRIVEQRSRGRERIVGDARYVAGAGRLVVRVPIARFARRLAGCSHGLRVQAVLHPDAEQRRGLDTYRLTSRAPCRPTAGPKFGERLAPPSL